jgi:hypothetical protein
MTTRSDNHCSDFREADHNLRRARIAGYVLLTGLSLEVVSCIVWFHGVETLASLICVALVAGGVAGEIFFEYKARLAHKGTPIVAAPPISRVDQPAPDRSYSRSSVNRTGLPFSIRRTIPGYGRHFLNELAEACRCAAGGSALRQARIARRSRPVRKPPEGCAGAGPSHRQRV